MARARTDNFVVEFVSCSTLSISIKSFIGGKILPKTEFDAEFFALSFENDFESIRLKYEGWWKLIESHCRIKMGAKGEFNFYQRKENFF